MHELKKTLELLETARKALDEVDECVYFWQHQRDYQNIQEMVADLKKMEGRVFFRLKRIEGEVLEEWKHKGGVVT